MRRRHRAAVDTRDDSTDRSDPPPDRYIMVKRESLDVQAAALSFPERVLLFCVAGKTE
jgi:hypothetical protein